MTDYLVRDRAYNWRIARPGCIEDTRNPDGSQIPVTEAPLRLAWFDRDDGALIVFDHEEPDVQRLPD